MTLNDLYKEFEAARDDLLDHMAQLTGYPATNRPEWTPDYVIRRFEALAEHQLETSGTRYYPPREQELYDKAGRYNTAREFNILDSKQIDMMWKLKRT